jgi:hypothetical protein
MIPKSGHRFSEKIILSQKAKATRQLNVVISLWGGLDPIRRLVQSEGLAFLQTTGGENVSC